MTLTIADSPKVKIASSDNYNYVFSKSTGQFLRWGRTKEDDPTHSKYGPELLDIEISTGPCKGQCKFCYKSNGSGKAVNMSLETFKTMFDKFPKTLTQIAFGITDVHANPDFFKIMAYTRQRGVIPNYTCHGLDVTDAVADETARLCGAVSVSIMHGDRFKQSYDAINRFIKAGCRQVNIHCMLSEESYGMAFKIVNDIPLFFNGKLNAIVFLMYKNKGRNPDAFHAITDIDKYRKLVEHCERHKVRYGFDSCSAHTYLKVIKDRPDASKIAQFVEPCESTKFSLYINANGIAFPCSFLEDEQGWTKGLDAVNCNNFLKDVWNHPMMVEFRNHSIQCTDRCPCHFKL